jgi:mono/diheme cytochrome c family protein
MTKGIIVGAAGVLFAGLLGAYFFIILGGMPANADSPPPALEKWAAHKSLRATIAREAPKGPVPIELNEGNLLAGVKLYAANCAVCHGGADGRASNIAKGLYQHAPQLGDDGVEDDPEGKIYWKVDHGIRMTGMPAFSPTLTQTQIWQLTLFLKHMDHLTPSADEAWKTVPSQAVTANR